MNPLTNMKNVKKLSEQELKRNFKTSWHDQYKDSAWIFVGGLDYSLTEGDVICIFSQYGEVVNINLVRDKITGKTKGFCFICFEDQRSTVLSIDNFNGIKILGKIIRVDHVSDYKMPKTNKNTDEETLKLHELGCGPSVRIQMPIPSTELPAFAREEEAPPDAFRLPPRLPIRPIKTEPGEEQEDNDLPIQKKIKKEKKSKKEKKKKKSKKKSKKDSNSSSDGNSTDSDDSENEEQFKYSKSDPKIKQETIEEDNVKTNRKSKENNEEKHRKSYHHEYYRNEKRHYDNKYNDRRYERNDDKYKHREYDRKRKYDYRDKDESKSYKR